MTVIGAVQQYRAIGPNSDAGVKAFYDKMVDAKVVKADLDLSKAYTTEYVCKGLGKELVK